MRTIILKNFTELTTDEQKYVIENFPEKFYPQDEWYESSLDYFTEILESIGFSNVEIGFSGFCSQGDGAHFTGNYSYKKECMQQVKIDYPSSFKELFDLVVNLSLAERKSFYQIKFKITQQGMYRHENSTSFDFEDVSHNYGHIKSGFKESDFIEPCREFMKYIYRSLEKEYDELSSVEYIIGNAECYDYLEFSEDQLNKK